MANLSGAESATTTTPFKQKKSQSRNQSPSDSTATPLSQDELRNWWPFTRVDGKVLESLHRKHIKSNPPPAIFDTAEEAFL